jgi:hypothetical protein
MSTHDYVVDNASGSVVRADINSALAAIVSNNSSATEPATTYAYMWWADTANALLKIRNAADSAWVTVADLAGGAVVRTATDGSAVIPSGATGDRDGSPSAGFLRFNTTTGGFEGYDGSDWGEIGGGGGATGGGSDMIFHENGQTVTTDYTITTNFNAGTFGPVTIDSGVSVTIPSGSVWTIV